MNERSTYGVTRSSDYLAHRKHKYIHKIKTSSGKTRYFYTQEELQAYYDRLNRAEKDLEEAEKRYAKAAEELKTAIASTSGAARQQAEMALDKTRQRHEDNRRQRKKNQNVYEEATRKAQHDAKEMESELSKRFDVSVRDKWHYY